MSDDLILKPVGFFHCGKKYRFEAPRQGVFHGGPGTVEFLSGMNFEQALADLAGFSRIWLIFGFHLNTTWKPKVSPPVITPPGKRIGVFATRSPHRPNPVGLSCVRLLSVENLTLHVEECDLLDGSPVYDVKPYIPAADSFPDSTAGWLDQNIPLPEYSVEWNSAVREKADFLLKEGGHDLESFCRIQLGTDPLNRSRKRLSESENGWELGFRTWRILFSCDTENRCIRILDIRSHYAPEELLPGAPDRYGDKDLHRIFLQHFQTLTEL